MRGLWPEFLLAALFILGDILFTGYMAFAAGAVAGVLAYAASFLSGRRKASLILEGLVLSSIALIAGLTAFPGGSFCLMEIAAGAYLLFSGLCGRPALARIAGPLARGMIPGNEDAVLSKYSGGAFLIHGCATVVLSLAGAGNRILILLLLVPVFSVAGVLARKRIGRAAAASLPCLLEEGDSGQATLVVRGRRSGHVRVREEGSCAYVEAVELEAGDLPSLEKALAGRGFRSMVITHWPGDPIQLEINGFSGPDGNRRKRILR